MVRQIFTAKSNFTALFLIIIVSISILNAQNASVYETKAKKGDPLAQMYLGLCYNEGKGVEKNYEQAAYWYEKAAKQGLAEAQVLLGNCYKEGKGREIDSTTAYYWYELASQCRSSLGLDALGDCYYYGIGVERDVIRARHFYTQASERGYKKSKIKYDKIRFQKQDDPIIDLN